MARKPVVSTALMMLMHERRHHAWTLEDLQAGLAENDKAADFSSVFRAAEKLAGEGAIRKLTLDDGRARFELIEPHHDHLHCTQCGTVVPVPCVIGPREFAALERAAGIAITDHHLVLSGICRMCRDA
ncbi:MAG TPA: transcriptional repressor [Stellaceae bacterium]|nr:transcriptional repressor [Stellaceae bacterium]